MIAVYGVIRPSKPLGTKKKHHKFEGICNAFSSVCKIHLFVFLEKTLRNSVSFPAEKIHFGREGLEIFRTLSSSPQLSQHTIHRLLSRTLAKTCILYMQYVHILYFFYQRSITSISTSTHFPHVFYFSCCHSSKWHRIPSLERGWLTHRPSNCDPCFPGVWIKPGPVGRRSSPFDPRPKFQGRTVWLLLSGNVPWLDLEFFHQDAFFW